MRITESKLRSIIRSVIRESIERDNVINEGWREKTAAALSGLAMFMGSLGGASGKPLDKYEASIEAEHIVEDGIGSLNIPLKRMVEDVLLSVDEKHVDIVKSRVIDPWIHAIRVTMNNSKSKYYDSLTGDFKPFAYKILRNLLIDKVDEFINSGDLSRNVFDRNNTQYISGRQSSLTKDQMNKYRAGQNKMQNALKSD